MSQANLLSPPLHISPPTALALSQKAPLILSHAPTSSLPWPLSLLFSRETPESWTMHENLFYSALRTGDETTANAILERFEARFGSQNERIITLRGLYNEATARSDADLEKVCEGYDKILSQDPTNMGVRKRRVAVLKALGRSQDAIAAVTALLENSPTDVESWAEASELYASQAAWGQAIFCAEEVLLVMPNAWSAHAHIATLHYLSATSATPPSLSALSLSLKHFCRSIELNDSYLRGYYGLKMLTAALIPLLSESTSVSNKRHNNNNNNNQEDDDIPLPKLDSVKKLEEIATRKLADIVRNASQGKTGWTGYDEAEVIAARALLDRDGKIER
ncbi:tetratricopeptide repeat domain-containing protein [Pleosporales sp. CAS-2024a]